MSTHPRRDSNPDPRPVSLVATELHELPRKGASGDLQLRIARPLPGFAGGAAPDPEAVLYLLDGDLYFGTATETTRLLNQFMGELPPVLVVGIGYGGDDPTLQAELRTRDCTPTAVEEFGAMMASLGREPALPADERMGGADAFLDLLAGRVRPFVEERFPVSGAPALLFGSSLAGLLGAWALLDRPDLFDGWILASPALWWDDGWVLQREESARRAGAPLRGRVYLAAGSREEGIGVPHLDAYRLVSNTRLLGERLASRAADPGAVTVEVLEGESHTSVVPRALLNGLRTLLPPRQPPTAP